jgi:hypothetical protein
MTEDPDDRPPVGIVCGPDVPQGHLKGTCHHCGLKTHPDGRCRRCAWLPEDNVKGIPDDDW